MAVPCAAQTIEWNDDTLTFAVAGGQYGRIVRLPNDDLLLTGQQSMAQWGPSYVWHSSDDGETWGSRIKAAEYEFGHACNPEPLVLDNGNILLCYNPRPLTDGQGHNYAICTTISTDNGYTWSEPTTVYTADEYFENGCWEPAAVQLPSGEIKLFFANENNFRLNDDQDISMCTSNDGGLTWSNAQRVSYRPDDRDGMPSPLILKNGRLVVGIEDSGLSTPGYKLAIVDPETGERWDANNPPLAYGSNVGGPYLRQFPTGETVLSCQLNETKDVIRRQVIYLGDENAENFTNATEPFTGFMDEGERGVLNSVFIKNAYTVTAISPTTINGQFGLWTIDGYLTQPGINYYYDTTPNNSGIELTAGNAVWSTSIEAWAQHIGSPDGQARWVWGEGGSPGNAYFVADGSSVVTVSGPVQTNSATFYGTGYIVVGSELTLVGDGRIVSTVEGSGGPVIAAPLGGNVGLTKAGPGVVMLAGNNTYTGPTVVDEGRLIVYGSIAAGSNVSVQNGATLGGAGTLYGNVGGAAGGNIAPGMSTNVSSCTGTLTINGDLDLSAGVNVTWELSDLSEASPGSNFDQIVVGGSLTLGANASLTLDFGLLDTQDRPDNATLDCFWFSGHSWKIIDVDNIGGGNFGQVVNATYAKGTFSTSIGSGSDVFLNYTTNKLYGDANLDGIVNDTDATIMAANWLSSGAGWSMGDFNDDHTVDSKDAAILAANWLKTESYTASVPEPALLLPLLVLGATLFYTNNIILF